MRAQVSLEYLVISAVALGLLSLSIMALSGIRDSAAGNMELLRFRSSAISLSNAINEVCALGSGNGREIALSAKLSITSEGGTGVDASGDGFGDASGSGASGGFGDGGFVARFVSADANASIVRKSFCDVDAAGELLGLVYVDNEDGLVIIRGR